MNFDRCAACKYSRRKCHSNCIFYPYFPFNNTQRFACVHRIYGASNVGKMLQVITIYFVLFLFLYVWISKNLRELFSLHINVFLCTLSLERPKSNNTKKKIWKDPLCQKPFYMFFFFLNKLAFFYFKPLEKFSLFNFWLD